MNSQPECSHAPSGPTPVRKPQGVDPTTSQRIYTAAEAEFLREVERYKAETGRKFCTCTELLGVAVGMGYVRVR